MIFPEIFPQILPITCITCWLVFGQLLAFETNMSRVVGGRDAIIEEMPWIVSIRAKRADRPFGAGHLCGGSLITRSVVLTATHCFLDKLGNVALREKDIHVVAGTADRMRRMSNTFSSNCRKIKMHWDYNYDTTDNDLALVFLKKPIKKTRAIRTIRLADRNFTVEENSTCFLGGWGTEMFGGSTTRYLKIANITIFNRRMCTRVYPNLPKKIICAGSYKASTDACQGDSGGPLICGNIVVGVISWGYKCASDRFPGVYMDVREYRTWIDTEAAARGNIRSKSNLLLLFDIIYWLISKIFGLKTG